MGTRNILRLNAARRNDSESLPSTLCGIPSILAKPSRASDAAPDALTLGAAWRWDDSISALVGFQVSDELFIGYAYDYTTTDLNKYNNGSHEIMLRWELRKVVKLLSPRFF